VLATASAPNAPWPAEAILRRLADGGPAAVALSGGVDSAVVAHLAFRALGPRAAAVTFQGPAVADREVASARATAAWIGIAHVTLESDPLSLPQYRANPSNRCYFCRAHEAGRLRAWGEPRGVLRYLDGVHADDLGDDRPGLRALDEAGVLHPLLSAGWGKKEVRAYARAVGIPNPDRPSDACLASRVRHGEPITPERLARVQAAEERLYARGFRRVRVRSEGAGARVEVDPGEVAKLLAEPLASTVRGELVGLGFASVTIDPAGYRWRPSA
jgi:pyridinium-3,5-biscarboxylic acid mononucleotide sulfurtransferase